MTDRHAPGTHQGLTEHSWVDLTERSLPSDLARLAGVLGRRNGRPIQVFVTPLLEAGLAQAGLALPLRREDAIVLDPCLLDRSPRLSTVVVRELARIAHPRWRDAPTDDEGLEEFVSVLASLLLTRHPSGATELETLVRLTMDLVEPDRSGRTHAPKDGPWRRNTTAPSSTMNA